MRSFSNFILGIFAGALVGATAALLLTPSSGEDLRSDIQSQADKLFSDFRTTVETERKRLEEELEALKRGEIQIS
jgi:gas vesicle protein